MFAVALSPCSLRHTRPAGVGVVFVLWCNLLNIIFITASGYWFIVLADWKSLYYSVSDCKSDTTGIADECNRYHFLHRNRTPSFENSITIYCTPLTLDAKYDIIRNTTYCDPL